MLDGLRFPAPCRNAFRGTESTKGSWMLRSSACSRRLGLQGDAGLKDCDWVGNPDNIKVDFEIANMNNVGTWTTCISAQW